MDKVSPFPHAENICSKWRHMAGKSKKEEINKAERERGRVQIGFRLSDTQTAEKEENICECAPQKPLAGDWRLRARWLMLLMDLFRT